MEKYLAVVYVARFPINLQAQLKFFNTATVHDARNSQVLLTHRI